MAPVDIASIEPITMTVAQCAAQMQVSHDRVVRWIEGGHLAAFYPPGKSPSDGQRGPKALRIFKRDWESFLRSRTVTGTGDEPRSVAAAPARGAAPGRVTGKDGVKRCVRKSQQSGH